MPIRFRIRSVIPLALAAFLALPSAAQQTPQPSDPQPPPQTPSQTEPQPAPKPEYAPPDQKDQTPAKPGVESANQRKIENKEQSRRDMGVLPQFGVASQQNAPPLTTRERFHVFARSAFDPAILGIVGLQAGVSQAEDSFPGYGQGAQGYGKRFGATLADEVSAGFGSNFFYPTLFKHDPRYFRLGEGGFRRRFFYGVKQEFVCHTDKGGHAFNISNVLGALTSGGISNIYYPSDDRGAALTLSRSGIALAYGLAGGLYDEFWPDIHTKLFHKHNKNGAASNPTR